jgi:hypothetical protein
MHSKLCNGQRFGPSTNEVLKVISLFFTIGAFTTLMSSLHAEASVSNPSSTLILSAGEIQKKPADKSIKVTKPEWSDLTPSQKIALLPLRDNWNFLGDTSKRKWIALSVNFQSLAVAEQVKLHARMNEWVTLSQQQRTEARLNFTQSKLVPQSHKSATWEAYQALSPEDKKQLARIENDRKTKSSSSAKVSQAPKLNTAPVKIWAQPAQVSAKLILDRHTLLLKSIDREESSSKN